MVLKTKYEKITIITRGGWQLNSCGCQNLVTVSANVNNDVIVRDADINTHHLDFSITF